VILLHERCKDLIRGEEIEHFAGSVVEPFSDDVEFVLCVSAELCAFGEILADESIGVFVAAALPRTVRVSKEDLDPGVGGAVSS
jgi:hypothetical protein